MNYYKRHLGDYAKDTGWLTTYQHGVYALLLDWYYANEGPIPHTLVYRIVRAVRSSEKRAVDEIVSRFFMLHQEDGLVQHQRADLELHQYKTKVAANSLIAIARETTKRARNVVDSCESGEPSHKPLAISHKEDQETIVPSKLETPVCPQSEIVNLYHEHLPSLARVRDWTAARQGYLRKRWNESPERQSLEWWGTFFDYVQASDFLMGRKPGRGGEPFECDLEWLVRPKNFIKVIEGKYENRRAA